MGAPSKTRSRSMRGKKNAAKPAETHRVALSVSVSPEIAQKISETAKALGVNKGRAIDFLLSTKP